MFRIKRSFSAFDVELVEKQVVIQPALGTHGKPAVLTAIAKSEQVLSQFYLSKLDITDPERTLMDYFAQKGWTVLRLFPVLEISDQGDILVVYQEEQRDA